MKYGNKKVIYDGIKFDSKKEARRYSELKLMEKAGVIDHLELQKSFVLIPAQYEYFPRFGKNGKMLKAGKKCVEQSCKYKADFYYHDKENKCWVVEDTKGMRTKDYIIKRKLMLHLYGVKIKEV